MTARTAPVGHAIIDDSDGVITTACHRWLARPDWRDYRSPRGTQYAAPAASDGDVLRWCLQCAQACGIGRGRGIR